MTLKLYLISVLFIARAIADTGLYCKAKPSIGHVDWEMCRTCNDASKKCDEDPPNECFCENIKINNPRTNELMGGSDCNDDFCYVSQNSKCIDALTREGYDAYAYALQEGWHHEKIFRSRKACQSKIKMDTGNNEIMEGVKIVGDYLNGVEETIDIDKNTVTLDSTKNVPLVVHADNNTECREECQNRCGMCGAWSFNEEELQCYLHTVDSCCGQKGKQEESLGWTSGYYCAKCWSTGPGDECPCSLKERHSIPGCSIAQSAGANKPEYGSPSGELKVFSIPINEDKCACEPWTSKITGRRKCIKPVCHDSFLNPCGKCTDLRRCRTPKSKYVNHYLKKYGDPKNCKELESDQLDVTRKDKCKICSCNNNVQVLEQPSCSRNLKWFKDQGLIKATDFNCFKYSSTEWLC